MKTIFDLISSVLFTKKHIELDVEEEKEFSLYMLNRWVSMHSPVKASIINNTINKYWRVFETKQDQFNFLFHILTKERFKKISYIKKTALKKQKASKDEEEQLIRMHAHNNFMSIAQYKELQKNFNQ